MIIIVNKKLGGLSVDRIVSEAEKVGLKVDISTGIESITIGMVGDVSRIDRDKMMMIDGVEKILSVSEPYKLANKKFHPTKSVIDVAGVKIGGAETTVMAGPCSVESEEQIIEIAMKVKQSGGNMLRGGAYKPRTSPYAFQGLENEGLNLLSVARSASGLPIVSEMTSVRQLDLFLDKVDMIQVGARNMQNFEMLKEIGETEMPVLLKRGLSNTIEEWLMSAEYIMSRGNKNIVLCERGIRTFENFTRNTLDLSAVVACKEITHLPIIVDPSHATGKYWMVEPLAMAAIACGADGIMVEVHNDPKHALCDGPQSLTPERFGDLMKKVDAIHATLERGENAV